VGIATPKKELKRTFDIIDKAKTGRVRIEDIKSIAKMLDNEELLTDDEDSQQLQPSEMKLR